MTGRKDPTITVRIPKDLRDKLQEASERDRMKRPADSQPASSES